MNNFKAAVAENKTNFFKYDITLNNEIVRLRPLKVEDMPTFSKFHSDHAIWKYFAIKMRKEQDMEEYINDTVQQKSLGLRYHFVVEDIKKNKVVGSTAFGNFSPKDNRIEIGWSWIETLFQGTGINKNAKFHLLNFAFDYLNMERVEFKTDVLNVRARAGLIKIGATERRGITKPHSYAR